jgi:hypothetical protein
LKHLLVGALTLSSLAFAYPPVHGAAPVAPPPPRVAPIAVPPPPQGAIRYDNDTRRASELLRAFDDATARRDLRTLAHVDRQFGAFLQQELREARMDRGGRGVLKRLNRIDSELARLQGRMNPRTLSAKRALYVELVQLADGRPGRGGRRF